MLSHSSRTLPASHTHGGGQHEWQRWVRTHWGVPLQHSSLLQHSAHTLSAHSSSSGMMAQHHRMLTRASATSSRSFAASPKPATRSKGRTPSAEQPSLPEELARKQVTFVGVVKPPSKDSSDRSKSCRIEVCLQTKAECFWRLGNDAVVVHCLHWTRSTCIVCAQYAPPASCLNNQSCLLSEAVSLFRRGVVT